MAAASSSNAVDAAPVPANKSEASFGCGFAAGLFVTALLHPWDRALYFSVIHRKPFLTMANWRNPYHAIMQTLLGRTISGGLFFPLEDHCSAILGSKILGGQAAGVLNGFILNPLSFVKYQSWSANDLERSFSSTSRRLLRDAGPLVFMRGAIATMCRDATFGMCFAVRKLLPLDDGRSTFAASLVCAAAGTTLSSPFNYLRNQSYAEKSVVPLESLAQKRAFWRSALEELQQEVRGQPSRFSSLKVLQQRLNVGWGTLRVAVGMALTDHVYRTCNQARSAAM
jgi:hypothetical protein